ncbi:uncharacterized protein LOC120133548 [Hibiscus syriacus]|uniref:uncharacterized protein LOC120133548 n=1 Tax=Hibiscus syriacus TaxID=106335 RepID=UPI00192491A8|nr:uncharacterized protein LOC120133548 [Hibiscus syriacus]XP_039006046.1 uncharacterized protein LOC120133548 [Hibiscus syriacus]
MTGFWFHQFGLRRFNIKGRGHGLRIMRARLARDRRVNRRVMQSLIASQVAAAEIEEQIRRIREEVELRFVANVLDDLWVHDCLFEVENDPLMRNALERINSQNMGRRSTLRMNRTRTFTRRHRRRPGPQ